MTEPNVTRPAVWNDLKRVAELMEAAGVAYALIGGYALAVHGLNRLSEDVDLLVDPAPENTRRWISALSLLPDGAAGELAGEDDLFERLGPYAVRINDEFTIDVMPSACGHHWDELRAHIEERWIDGVKVRVLGLKGLLLTKEGMRPRDQADAEALRRALARK